MCIIRANPLLRVKAKVKNSVCCRRRLSHTEFLTVILALTLKSGAALDYKKIRIDLALPSLVLFPSHADENTARTTRRLKEPRFDVFLLCLPQHHPDSPPDHSFPYPRTHRHSHVDTQMRRHMEKDVQGRLDDRDLMVEDIHDRSLL